MSLLEEFNIAEKIQKELKNDIKYYHVIATEETSGQIKRSLFFVTNDDKVYAMGDNSNGILGLGNTSTVESPEEVIELSGKRIKGFFFGKNFGLGLSSDGNLYSWGRDKFTNFNSTYFSKPTPIKLFGEIDIKIKQVCCCDTYVLVLLDNGIVLVWGHIYEGTINGQDKHRSIRTPEELTSVNTDNW